MKNNNQNNTLIHYININFVINDGLFYISKAPLILPTRYHSNLLSNRFSS